MEAAFGRPFFCTRLHTVRHLKVDAGYCLSEDKMANLPKIEKVKKISGMIVLLALLCSASQVWAQDMVRKASVPEPVLSEFEARFGEVPNVAWLQQGEEIYGARFEVKEKATEALFLPNGQWFQTTEEIAYREMPDSARAFCRGNYAQYQAKEILKVSTRKYGILYELGIVGEGKWVQLTFDMHGGLVETKEKPLEEEQEEKPNSGVKEKFGKLLKKNSGA